MNPEDWQPIETAPKDGSWIQLRIHMFLSGGHRVARWGRYAWLDRNGNVVYSYEPFWRPLSNPEPERTSDEVCAPQNQNSCASVLANENQANIAQSTVPSNATGSERSTRTESVAPVGGPPRTDAEYVRACAGTLSGWGAVHAMRIFACGLELDLLAARAEVEQLKSQLTSIIPNSTPASPAWLAKAAQREDALMIAELRKEVERLTKERDEQKHIAEGYFANAVPTGCPACAEGIACGSVMGGIQHVDCIFAGRDSLRQQLAEMQKERDAIAANYRNLCDLMGRGDSPNPEHRAQWLVNRVALRESQIDALYDRNCDAAKVGGIDFTGDDTPTRLAELVADFRSQLSAATARAEEWEKVARRLQDAAILERIDFRSCAKHYGNHKAEEWDGYKEMTAALSAFDALTQREQQA